MRSPHPFARLVDVGVLIVTPERTLDFMSDRARELLHDAPDDDLAACWSQIRARIEPVLDRADATENASSPSTVHGRDEDGPEPLQMDVYPLSNPAGMRPGYLVLLKDDDAFQYVEQALHLALQRQQTNRLYEALAHDMRQPIGAILIHLKVLEELGNRPPHDGAQTQKHFTESLDTIRNEVQELDRSLRLLLHELSPSDAEEPLSLRAVVQHVAGLIEPQARKENIVLCTELPDEAFLVRGRRARIKHAVLSLAIHALDATHTGTITLRLRARDGRACIEVTGEGPGLSEDAQAHLFERPSTPEEEPDLALYLARETTRSHGGDIEVRSTPGEGTTFTLLLPLLPEDDA